MDNAEHDCFWEGEESGFLKAGLQLALQRLESSRQKTNDDIELIDTLRDLLDG